MPPNLQNTQGLEAAVLAIAAAILGGGGKINRFTHTGDGGGAGYWFSIGDLKVCVVNTGSITVSGAGNKNINFPAGVFTAAPVVVHDKYGSAVFASQNGNQPSTSSAQIYFGSGTGSVQIMAIAIGL